jgi:hypothetical protein
MSVEIPKSLRIATFNVSMEALNYIDRSSKKGRDVSGDELTQALKNNTQQIRNIAEIIQRVNPDIILLNEFDNVDNDHKNILTFIKQYLAKGQHNQLGINYPYYYQGKVNTGVRIKLETDAAQSPIVKHGFGYFEGHFGMVLLSKYPIDTNNIRSFQHFKWRDMPSALKPIDPITGVPWYDKLTWQALRLSSKSHWDIPIKVMNTTLHVLASHPTPPVFDGPEKRNSKRNHDEIRFWFDYINNTQPHYIYDDDGNKGGLSSELPFVILGDQNASVVEGDSINSSIKSLLNSDKIQDPKPSSLGGEFHQPNNCYAKYHTANWGMRADYVLPSTNNLTILDAGVYWPQAYDEGYRLIKSRQASSDHRLVWVDVALTK